MSFEQATMLVTGAADLGQRLRTDLAQRRHPGDLDRPVSPLGDRAGHLGLLRPAKP